MSTDPDCIFCKIVRGEIPATDVFRDADVVAFRDLNPQAPHHVLVIPAEHAANLSAFARTASAHAAQRLLQVCGEIGSSLGPQGYRIVANEGGDGGQTVHHLHFHVLAGRAMTWPPG
jgi:histidine triad (HIT) family protein